MGPLVSSPIAETSLDRDFLGIVSGSPRDCLGIAPGFPLYESGAEVPRFSRRVSIALMVAESLAAFVLVAVSQALSSLVRRPTTAPPNEGGTAAAPLNPDPLEVAPPNQLVPTSWWACGLVASLALCVGILSPMFHLPPGQILLAGLLACLVAILAVRALGQTDLNPVSGVGKLSQIVFALVAPGHVVANLVAGALAEAGAMQAGDLLQDLKAGHLLKANPRAQFYGQLIGATASVFVTVGAYNLYQRAYGVPSAQFKAPVASVWLKMALLMQQGLGALPPSTLVYAKGAAATGVALSLLEATLPHALSQLLPQGMSVGVGMYLTPDFTVPRVLGALLELAWRRCYPDSHKHLMLVVASGLVLGEAHMGRESFVATCAGRHEHKRLRLWLWAVVVYQARFVTLCDWCWIAWPRPVS